MNDTARDARHSLGHAPASAAATDELDANAPFLQDGEGQRLNRKALLFVAGMVALLALSAALVFKKMGQDASPAEAREDRVVVPDLPMEPTARAHTSPPPAIANEALPDVVLPPLPPEPIPLAPQAMAPRSAMASVDAAPTLLERRTQTESEASARAVRQGPVLDAYTQALVDGGLRGLDSGKQPGAATPNQQATTDATSARFVDRPGALLPRGTYIRCVLETRIVTDLPGFTSCIVAAPVFSLDGGQRLLSRGSKLLGRYEREANGPRIAVVWDRILTPEGIDVSMSSPGVDNLGGAGHPGDYDAHWGSRMGAALLISLVSDAFGYAAAEHGPATTTIGNGLVTQQPFESATARTMERLANQALARAANRPATVTIPQGSVVNVYVAKDIDFSAVVVPR